MSERWRAADRFRVRRVRPRRDRRALRFSPGTCRKNPPVTASTFSSIHDFFDSGTWLVIRNLFFFFLVVFWLAVGLLGLQGRAPADRGSVARRDGDGPRARPAVRRRDHLHALPPARVPRGRARARARDPGDGGPALHARPALPGLPGEVEASFLVCPVCTTKLKQACVNCKAPLEALWQVCPYCETPVEPAAVELADAGRGRDRRRRRRSAPSRLRRRWPSSDSHPDQARRRRARARRRDPRADRAPRLHVRAGKLLRGRPRARREHYAEHSEKPFFGELVDFITSRPTLALVVEGEGAIATMRKTIGATNPADAEPGTIRGDLAIVDAEQPHPRLRFARVGAARDRALVRRR